MKYYYRDAAGHEIGPISEEELHAFRAGGLLGDETLVRPADTETWTSYATKFGPMSPTNASFQAGTRLTRKQWLAIGAVASLVAIFYGGSIAADAVLNRTPPSAVVSPGIAAAIPEQFSQFEISKTEVAFDNSGSLVSGHAQMTLTLKEAFYAKDDFMRRLVEKGDDPKAFESALARRDKLPPALAPVIPNGPSWQLFAEAKPRGYQTTATATLSASKQSRQWTFTDCVNAWVGRRGWVLGRVDWPPLPQEFGGLAPRSQLPRNAVLFNEGVGQNALRTLLANRQKFIADVRAAEEVVAQRETKYRNAMKQARESLDAGRFADSRKFLAVALESKPEDIPAREFLNEIYSAERRAGKQTRPQAGQAWENSLGMKFVPVPGTNALFGIWDVRVQDYQAFVTSTHREWLPPRFEQGPTHPAVNVNWEDAHAFCAWLTQTERASGQLGPDQSYRLPTDWEWSVAVGLNESPEGSPERKSAQIRGVYPWGSEWPPPRGAGNYSANLDVDDFATTSPVGSFAANLYGLYDMGGNVWQWCEDFYDGLSGMLVVRGGSFDFGDPTYLLSSFRGRPSYPRYFNIGFRCLVEIGNGVAQTSDAGSHNPVTIYPEIDGWSNNSYPWTDDRNPDGMPNEKGGRSDERLRVGGYGDFYISYLRFSLPANLAARDVQSAKLLLWTVNHEDGTPVDVLVSRSPSIWRPIAPSGRFLWRDRPNPIGAVGRIPASGRGVEVELDLTEVVRAWIANSKLNNGILLSPTATQNNYSTFHSSRSSDATRRPRLTITIRPNTSPAAGAGRIALPSREGYKR